LTAPTVTTAAAISVMMMRLMVDVIPVLPFTLLRQGLGLSRAASKAPKTASLASPTMATSSSRWVG